MFDIFAWGFSQNAFVEATPFVYAVIVLLFFIIIFPIVFVSKKIFIKKHKEKNENNIFSSFTITFIAIGLIAVLFMLLTGQIDWLFTLGR